MRIITHPVTKFPARAPATPLSIWPAPRVFLLDPVYTGKAFAGMLDYIRTGKVTQGSNVVFWHTGGVTALFAEKEIVGDIFS